MKNLPQNETRERIMDTAEQLFMSRGYTAVRLRDIAEEVGMRHASLYYYVPQGKEQLFVAVVKRSMARHKQEMTRLIAKASDDVQAQAYAVSDWLLSQPPLDLARMFEADLRELDGRVAAELPEMILQALTSPLIDALNKAQATGSVSLENTEMAAMSLIMLTQSARHIPVEAMTETRQAFGRKIVDMLLNGWLTR